MSNVRPQNMPRTSSELLQDIVRLVPALSLKPPSPDAMESLLSILRRVDGRLYFHLGEHDKGTDLILSAEGNADLMPLLQEAERSALLPEGWRVLAAYDGDFVIGRRNLSVLPETENGDVLYGLAQCGDRLWLPREVDFSFIFPSQQGASAFAKPLTSPSLRVEVSEYEGSDGYSQQVTVTKHMLPTHALISEFESLMEQQASASGGRADGWGCFEAVA